MISSSGGGGAPALVTAHCDIKSKNFLVSAQNTVKLSDLGDAKSEAGSSNTRSSGRLLNRPAWLRTASGAGDGGSGGWARGLLSALGLGHQDALGSQPAVDEAAAGTPEWMAPELLAAAVCRAGVGVDLCTRLLAIVHFLCTAGSAHPIYAAASCSGWLLFWPCVLVGVHPSSRLFVSS